MNSFGRIFKLSIYGESHGECIGILLDGIPPGMSIDTSDFENDIQRRKPGGIGTTQRVEEDIPFIKSGVFNGFTNGAPLCIEFKNQNTVQKDYDFVLNQARPGHADFVANKKYKGYNDHRGGGHFSGRLTLAIVAAGVIAKKIISPVIIESKIIEIGGNLNIEEALDLAIKNNDSIGGIVECRVQGLNLGVGEPFFDSIESVLSHLVFSIPAVKGIEFGSGFNSAKLTGLENNDSYINESGQTKTNNSGGISGGISNGNELVFRIAVKPSSSTPRKQETFNFKSGSMEILEVKGRHDLCIALRVLVVLEAMTAIGLCDLIMVNKSANF